MRKPGCSYGADRGGRAGQCGVVTSAVPLFGRPGSGSETVLLRYDQGDEGLAMQAVPGQLYAIRSGSTDATAGGLFEGRRKTKLVEGGHYLLSLTWYIHLDPVKVGRVWDLPRRDRTDHLHAYRWSPFRS